MSEVLAANTATTAPVPSPGAVTGDLFAVYCNIRPDNKLGEFASFMEAYKFAVERKSPVSIVDIRVNILVLEVGT